MTVALAVADRGHRHAGRLPAGGNRPQGRRPYACAEGIKPEWYFLFLFKTLKLVPEGLGVAAFAIGASFFVVLPFLDRNAAREERSPRFTAVFLIALLYAATFEVLAWLDPGTRRAPEALTAPTYDLSRSVVNLLMLWVAIGFLLLYLQKLLAQTLAPGGCTLP